MRRARDVVGEGLGSHRGIASSDRGLCELPARRTPNRGGCFVIPHERGERLHRQTVPIRFGNCPGCRLCSVRNSVRVRPAIARRIPRGFQLGFLPVFPLAVLGERAPRRVSHLSLKPSFLIGFTKDSCTSRSPRNRMRCAGDFENALCRLPFCFRLNNPLFVI